MPKIPQDENDALDPIEPLPPKDILVTMVSYDYGDKAIVRNEAGVYALIPKQYVKNAYNAQKVPLSVFENSEKPYNWSMEFQSFSLTEQAFLDLLYQNGRAEKSELTYDDLVNILRIRGKALLRRK